MQAAAIVVTALLFLLDIGTHRFQRATLAVANIQNGGTGSRNEIARLQMAMTPDLVGALKLLEWVFGVAAFVLLLFGFSWWVVLILGVLYLSGIFAGIGALIFKVMPHSWNLAVIEKHLYDVRQSHYVGGYLLRGAASADESLELNLLATELREEFEAGRASVERCAYGIVTGPWYPKDTDVATALSQGKPDDPSE